MKRIILPLLTASCLPLMTACPGNDTSGQEEVGESSTGETETTDDPTAETTVDPTTDTNDTSTTDPTTETTTDPTTETTTDPTTETTTDPTTETGTTDPTTETGGGVCGDAVIDAGEECEGADLGGADCVGLGYSGGELACTAECLFDTAGCFQSECGNGVVEPGEDCDGADLGAATCADFGFSAGELSCADDCTVVVDACTNCGDGVLQDPEICDGADLGGQTCVGLGYLGGNLSCSNACDALVEDLCTNSWWGEDFEGGAVLPPEWVLGGNANWFGSGTSVHAGMFAGETGNIADNQTSYMEVTLNFANPGTVQFWYRVSTESGWDYLRFFVDGVQQTQWSGNVAWSQSVVYNVAAGNHTLRWLYYKDGSVSSNLDTVWVDDIVTTNALLP